MYQQRLNDAAIALYAALEASGIKFGIFGGYAIAVLGGNRESKDIDCIASVSKQEILRILDGKMNFQAVPQTREDYVAFLWSDKPGRQQAVLVEIFCDQYPGSTHSMQNIQATTRTVAGQSMGSHPAAFLDPFYLFKGKLNAAATRAKFHDSADLRWLEGSFGEHIKGRKDELDLVLVGLAMKRYPELQHVFVRLGLNISRAQSITEEQDLNKLPRAAPGDVQRGLLG